MTLINLIQSTYKTLAAVVGVVGILAGGYHRIDSKLSDLATKSDIAKIRAEIDTLSGADRIFQLRPGYTYVLEPVNSGSATIIISGSARRTGVGEGCIYKDVVALFEDGRQIPLPGKFVGTGRQLTRSYSPIRSEFTLPENLQSGRITVTMQITYTCAGVEQVENTAPIPFILQE